MCEKDAFQPGERLRLTRRGFAALAGAAGVALVWPEGADAQEVTGADVEIATPDGTVDAYFVHPASGSAPGVIMWPDIFGLRPAFREMADRLAAAGYAVLVPNPFYRDVKGAVVGENEELFSAVDRLLPYMRNITPDAVVTDATALVGWLDEQDAVDAAGSIGVVGFCMSGSYTIRAAAALPERIGAGASFHGAGIVTDAPDSPHLLAPRPPPASSSPSPGRRCRGPGSEEPPRRDLRRPRRDRGLRRRPRLDAARFPPLRRNRGRKGLGKPACALRRHALLTANGLDPRGRLRYQAASIFRCGGRPRVAYAITRTDAMSRRCELTGKSPMVGNNVSHANNKSKRRFLPNLNEVTLASETLGETHRFRISAAALRTVDHRGGLDAFLAAANDAELSPKALKLKRDIAKAQAPAPAA